eukprot:6211992-Pleurochrysis_carterae.AAC.1
MGGMALLMHSAAIGGKHDADSRLVAAPATAIQQEEQRTSPAKAVAPPASGPCPATARPSTATVAST